MWHPVDAFKAIGEPTRLRALRLLVRAGHELCACELIDALDKPQYAISRSLGALVDAELLEERRDGRMMLYTLAHSPLNDALFLAVSRIPLTGELAADDSRLQARLAQRDTNLCIRC